MKPTLVADIHFDSEKLRDILHAIIESTTFSGALRLQELLTYIVEEKLAGRQDNILGKTIAADVYNRKTEGLRENDKVVRVDASRLRRRLDQYYASEGQQDAIKITIPLGGYKPQFIGRAHLTTKATPHFLQSPNGTNPGNTIAKAASISSLKVQRQIMFEKSPASMQALKFALQARRMIWPPSDPVCMNAALDFFERAITLDEKYFGGYAGAATIYAFKALLPNQSDEIQMLAKANDLASKAAEMSPMESWVQSALGWIAFVEKDYVRSEKLSSQSLVLNPDDLFAREFHAAIQALTGKFEECLATSLPFAESFEQSGFSNYLNSCIVANFYLGRYDDTIANLHMLRDMDGDISPLLMVYFAAAYQAKGDAKTAHILAHDLHIYWPDFQPEKLLFGIFRNSEYPKIALDLLYAAGWPSR